MVITKLLRKSKTIKGITVGQLAQEFGIKDNPEGRYKASDVIAEFNRDLIDKYGAITADTVITREEANFMRTEWSKLPHK